MDTKTDAQFSRQLTLITAAAIGCIITFYFVFLYFCAVNIPRLDDYTDLLKFTVDFLQSSTSGDRLALVFAHHIDHITALNRVLALAYYILTGELNFKHLVYLGNAFVVLSFLLMLVSVPHFRYKSIVAISVALLLFQPQSWQTSIWSMAALSNRGVWPFGFVALMLVNHSRPGVNRLLMAFGFALAATFVQGNGVVALLLVPLVLPLRSPTKTRILVAAVWLVFAFLLHHYVLAAEDPASLKRNEGVFRFALQNPQLVLVYFLSLIGSCLSKNIVLATLLGSVGVAYTVYLCVEFFRGRYSTMTLFVLYVFLSLLVTSVFRAGFGWDKGVDTVRYFFYSQLFWGCLLLEFFRRRAQLQSQLRGRLSSDEALFSAHVLVLIVALVLNLSCYMGAYPKVKNEADDLLNGLERWLVERKPISTRLPILASVLAAQQLDRAMELGLYNPFGNFDNYVQAHGLDVQEHCNDVDAVKVQGVFAVDTVKNARLTRFSGWAQIKQMGIPQKIVLCGQRQAFVFDNIWSLDYFAPNGLRYGNGSIYNVDYLIDSKLLIDTYDKVIIHMPKSRVYFIDFVPGAQLKKS